MSPRAAAAAVARSAGATVHAPARPRVAPRPAPARRRSGAAAKPRTRATGVALPRYDFVAILDRLLRGPAYIALVGVLLAGIVFFNVDVLELNHGIARTDTRSAQLKRENAALTLQLAKLGSSERIQQVALQRGLVLPQPGDVRYLRAHPSDAAQALRVMTTPDPNSAGAAAPAVVTQQSTPTPASAVTPVTTPVAPTTAATPTQPVTTTTPATTTPSTTTTTTAPSTTTPASTAAPPATSTATQGGAAAAPAGQ